MNNIHRSSFLIALFAGLFFLFGFSQIDQNQTKEPLPPEAKAYLQSVESHLILLEAVSDRLKKRIVNPVLANYAHRVDSVSTALHREYCQLIIQNQWDIHYELMPEDTGFLWQTATRYQIDNEQFLDQMILLFDRLVEMPKSSLAVVDAAEVSNLLEKIYTQHDLWKNTALRLKNINENTKGV